MNMDIFKKVYEEYVKRKPKSSEMEIPADVITKHKKEEQAEA